MKDIGSSDNTVATPLKDLNPVLAKFTVKNIDKLPGVADKDPGELVGMLNHGEEAVYAASKALRTALARS